MNFVMLFLVFQKLYKIITQQYQSTIYISEYALYIKHFQIDLRLLSLDFFLNIY